MDLLSTHYGFKSTPVAFCSIDSSSYLQNISGCMSAKWQTIKHEIYRTWFHSYNIKTHCCVSVAKKAVMRTTVLFTGITNSPFSILVSITTWPISIKFTYVWPPYMQLYLTYLMGIHLVVCNIFFPEIAPFSSHFLLLPLYKNNFEPTKDMLLRD